MHSVISSEMGVGLPDDPVNREFDCVFSLLRGEKTSLGMTPKQGFNFD
jgi:hypothetical protein